MKLISAIAIAFFHTLVGSVHAVELSEAEIRARDYSYKTATFGMRLSDFEKAFSPGFPSQADLSKQTVSYIITVTNSRLLSVEFSGERLSHLNWFIAETEISGSGGIKELQAKMLELFGRPHHSVSGTFVWNFPNVNRHVVFNHSDAGALVGVRVTDPAPPTPNSNESSFDLTDIGLE